MNRLFVAKKPIFISSNHYLKRIKRKYGVKKAGFSGTLDPFAKGTLIIAFGQYTKLFPYLKKTPKRYRATLYLGAYSETLDLEKISRIDQVEKKEEKEILEVLESFLGKQTQIPPRYSAKKINGTRAYKLVDQADIVLKECDIEIFSLTLLNYSHPFLSFEAEVSEGTYIRSLGYEIAQKLSCEGSLTSLERLNEGELFFDKEVSLLPFPYLNMEENSYTGDINDLLLGKKLSVENFVNQAYGTYYVRFDCYFSIIKIEAKVYYIQNKIRYLDKEE